jgi:catechol 2,3-dioxygenase-like lactoylglutathione lyase family enzyme
MIHQNRTGLMLFAIFLTGGVMAFSQQGPSSSTERANTTFISLGEHSKLVALPADRERIRSFYQEVLGCKLTVRSERLDNFQLGSTFNIGVIYDPSAPSASDIYKGIWLELQSDRPEELKAKILHFGIQGIDYFDKKHFYFQAPGGQVFRIIQTGEAL